MVLYHNLALASGGQWSLLDLQGAGLSFRDISCFIRHVVESIDLYCDCTKLRLGVAISGARSGEIKLAFLGTTSFRPTLRL